MSTYTPEQIREKFGLSYNEKHASKGAPGKYSQSTGGDGFATKDGAIFTEGGEYVGSVKGDGDSDYYSGYSKLTDAASSIKQKHEGKGFTDVDSLSDVAGAVHWLTKEQKAEEPEGPQAPEEPIARSEKFATARARVKQYEEDVLGGRKVFGRESFNQDPTSFYDRYQEKMGHKRDDGLYVDQEDQDRYEIELEDYNKARAEFDQKKADRLATN